MAETDYMSIWDELGGPIADKHNIPEDGGVIDREDNKNATRETFQAFLVEVYRKELRQQYRGLPLLDEVDPLAIKAIELHHWTPEVAKSMEEPNLVLALANVLSHLKLPEETRNWVDARLRVLPHLEHQQLIAAHYSPAESQ